MIDYQASKFNDKQIDQWKDYGRLCGAKTFLPNRPQFDFVHAIGTEVTKKEDPKRVFLMRSGNGTGKTTIIWNALANIIYGNVNIYEDVKDVQTGEQFKGFFNWPLFNNYPQKWPKKIWYVSNRDLINDIWEEAKNWLPSNEYHATFVKDSKDGKNYISTVKFLGTPWVLFFKTVDQEPKVFEGANISIAIFDEPPPKRLFTAAVGRLRSGGFILMPATPLMDAAWFVSEILDKLEDHGDTWDQQVPIWDNCIEEAGEWDLGPFGIQKKGNLEKQQIEFMIRHWDPDEVPARELGEFMHLTGVVYKTYSRDRENIFQDFQIWTPQPLIYMYRFLLDPHDRKPPAAMWLRMDQWGHIEVIREWPSPADPQYDGKLYINIKDSGAYTINDFVKIFFDIEKQLDIPPGRILDIIDPNFGLKKNANSGLRTFQEYTTASVELQRRLGYGRTFAFKTDVLDDLYEGHSAVKKFLLPSMIDGDRYLRIHDSCVNTDQALRFYSYKKQPVKEEEAHGLTDKIEKKYKDFADCLRYCLVLPWDFTELDKWVDRYAGGDYETSLQTNWRDRLAATRPGDAF